MNAFSAIQREQKDAIAFTQIAQLAQCKSLQMAYRLNFVLDSTHERHSSFQESVRTHSILAGLSYLITNTATEANILGHDGDALGMNRTKIGIFECSDEIGLSRFLYGHERTDSKARIRLEILSDFSNETPKRLLVHEKVGRLLELPDLT